MTLPCYLGRMLTAALASFLAIWIWVAGMPMAYLDPEYPYWQAKRDLIADCDLGDLVILGDSRAATDIVPAGLPGLATNLAVGGGKPIEALAALRRVLACPNGPERVILSFDMAHFMKPDLFWERSVRFGFLDRGDLAQLAQDSAATGDWSVHESRQSDGLPPALRAALYEWRFPTLYFNSVLKGAVIGRLWRNQAALQQGLAARGHYLFGTERGSSGIAVDASLDRFAPSPVIDRAFARLLAALHDSGIETWFVSMPVNEATWSAIRPDVIAGFHAYLADYAARYPSLRLVGAHPPHWPNEAFGDAFSHLNPVGAERFTAWLADRLRSAGSRDDQRLHAAPPSTQNEAQNGWFSDTGAAASARVAPSSKRGS